MPSEEHSSSQLPMGSSLGQGDVRESCGTVLLSGYLATRTEDRERQQGACSALGPRQTLDCSGLARGSTVMGNLLVFDVVNYFLKLRH